MDEQEQEWLIQRALERLNCPNPLFELKDFPFNISKCPKKDDPNWGHFELQDIDDHRHDYDIEIPVLKEEDRMSLLSLALGSYRIRQARKYTTLQVSMSVGNYLKSPLI